MNAVDELTAFMLKMALKVETDCPLEETMAHKLREFKAENEIPDEEDGAEFPQEAYESLAQLLEFRVNSSAIDAAKNIGLLLHAINALQLNLKTNKPPKKRQIKKLIEMLKNAPLEAAFLAKIAELGLKLVDWEHIAEMVVTTGVRRLEAAKTT